MLERDQNKSLHSGYIAKNKIHFTTKMLLFLFLKQQFQNQCQPTAIAVQKYGYLIDVL